MIVFPLTKKKEITYNWEMREEGRERGREGERKGGRGREEERGGRERGREGVHKLTRLFQGKTRGLSSVMGVHFRLQVAKGAMNCHSELSNIDAMRKQRKKQRDRETEREEREREREERERREREKSLKPTTLEIFPIPQSHA